MKVFNITISVLLFVIAVTALIFVIKLDEKKELLINNPEAKSENLVRLAKAYDDLLNVDPANAPSSQINRATLALNENKQKGIKSIQEALSNFKVQFELIKTYQENLVNTIVDVSDALHLTLTADIDKSKVFSDNLKNANTAEESLVAMAREIQSIQSRDDAIFRELTTIVGQLNRSDRIPFDVEKVKALKGLDGENQELFNAINSQISEIQARKSTLEDELAAIANAAGVTAPELQGDLTEATASLNKLFDAVSARLQVVADKKSEFETLQNEIAGLKSTKADREAYLALLNSWREYMIEYRTAVASEIFQNKTWVNQTFIRDVDYIQKYALVEGTVIKANPQWKTVQLNIGRALVVEQPIGDRGRTNKLRAPIMPGYTMDIERNGAKIGTLLITEVSECSAIGNIQSFTEIVKPGDKVRFSEKVRNEINVNLGGSAPTATKVVEPDNADATTGTEATDDKGAEGAESGDTWWE